jgi:hypothetical protein
MAGVRGAAEKVRLRSAGSPRFKAGLAIGGALFRCRGPLCLT